MMKEAIMAANLFETAAVAGSNSPKGKKAKDQVATPGVQLFAALNAVKTNVEAQLEIVGERIKGTVLKRASALLKRDSYEGIENGTIASLQLRIRNSRSGLTPEEIDLLNTYKIPFNAAPTKFVINPNYSGDTELLARISEALQGVEGLPADFLQKEVGNATVSEDSIKKVSEQKGPVRDALLPVVLTPAIRPALDPDADPLDVTLEALKLLVKETENAKEARDA